MWLLKQKYINLFLLPVYRRLKFEYIFPITIKNTIITCSDHQYGHATYNHWEKNPVLSLCNVIKHIKLYYFNDLQIYLFFGENFRLQLMMAFSPLQWVNLLLENGSINDVAKSNARHDPCKDERIWGLAKETWLKGNIVASFIQFSSLYDKGNKSFKTKLITILQDLICFSVEKGGMAIVANIIEHVKKFSVEKNEFSVLITLWYALFNSSLYDDNCLSDTLLEDVDFKVYLEPLIPLFGANFLKHNEVAKYQRLIETSLNHNMDNAAGILLRSLFNYYYKTGYISGCSAVYECCFALDIKLTKDQVYKYSLLKETDVKMKSFSQTINHPRDLIYKF